MFGKAKIQDLLKAKYYFEKSCEMGNQEGCDYYRKLISLYR